MTIYFQIRAHLPVALANEYYSFCFTQSFFFIFRQVNRNLYSFSPLLLHNWLYTIALLFTLLCFVCFYLIRAYLIRSVPPRIFSPLIA